MEFEMYRVYFVLIFNFLLSQWRLIIIEFYCTCFDSSDPISAMTEAIRGGSAILRKASVYRISVFSYITDLRGLTFFCLRSYDAVACTAVTM
jgi:hypothetical protein